jgi:hypothetical protein
MSIYIINALNGQDNRHSFGLTGSRSLLHQNNINREQKRTINLLHHGLHKLLALT